MGFDDQPIDVWCDIDLEEIDEYECFRPETTEWADRVHWARVLDLMRPVVVQLAAEDQLDSLGRRLSDAGALLSEVDCEGLDSLWAWPIMASRVQISNGGHRITAMRKQGVRWALGQCYLDDVGESVDPLHAYLPPSALDQVPGG